MPVQTQTLVDEQCMVLLNKTRTSSSKKKKEFQTGLSPMCACYVNSSVVKSSLGLTAEHNTSRMGQFMGLKYIHRLVRKAIG